MPDVWPALRRLFRLEDLIASAWLALLSPFSRDLLLAGDAGTVLLVVTALSFWLAILLRERPGGAPPEGARTRSRRWAQEGPLFGSIAVAAILLDTGLKQLDQQPLRLFSTIAFVAVAAVALAQERLTGRSLWPALPSLLRRALGWPFVLLLSEHFGQFLQLVVPTPAGGYLGVDARSLGERLFLHGLGLLIIGVLFAFFVVMPRQVLDPQAPSSVRVWALRFASALAAALLGAWITGPLLGGFF